MAETSLSNEGAPIPLLPPSTLLDPKEPQIKQWIFVAQQEIYDSFPPKFVSPPKKLGNVRFSVEILHGFFGAHSFARINPWLSRLWGPGCIPIWCNLKLWVFCLNGLEWKSPGTLYKNIQKSSFR